jgi:adenylate kinase
MRIVFLGPPGAGKGTQAELIAAKFQIPKISTGDILREHIAGKTTLGQKIQAIMDRGEYVPEAVIAELITERLSHDDCKNGYLFDGFPRTMTQIKFLAEAHIGVDFVIEIKVPEAEIVERLSGRRVHVQSGRVYHIHKNPPKNADRDDVTGDPLIHREDDKPETIKKRLGVYRDQTAPLVDYYKERAANGVVRYLEVDGNRDLQVVCDDILTQIAAKTITFK